MKGSSKRGAGSKKRGLGTKKNPVRPKVRANLGEPTHFRLQDEPDQVPHFHTQQYPPFQTQQYPPFQSQTYQNQPFIPPFQPHQFQPQSFPHFQTQPHQLDPLLEDNTLIRQFANVYREPQPSLNDDEDDDCVQEEEEENDDVQEIVPSSVQKIAFIPPFQPHQFQPQSFPHFQTQPHQLDPLLEDNTLIRQFANVYREPQPSLNDDEDDDCVQEEEEENDDVQEIVPSSVRKHWTSEE
ncbi:glutenin, low molecular weight subunit-like [Helianthus annuus]|uniref:glutenin, low molecular weight subunit-like n=1 Tax=Helianthus annuus TaxID=4232 RepID=UPI000B9022A1|nr:glutenin, low molecular weight subunit-like [Helianthus annuus]